MEGTVILGRERGHFLEDFRAGQVFEHWPGRTITEADNIQFSLLTMNQHPMHCDHAFAAGSEFGKPLVNSALTLAIVVGMTVPKGTRTGFGALHLATPAGDAAGTLRYAGSIGSGFTDADLDRLGQAVRDHQRDTPPCDGPLPPGRGHVSTPSRVTVMPVT